MQAIDSLSASTEVAKRQRPRAPQGRRSPARAVARPSRRASAPPAGGRHGDCGYVGEEFIGCASAGARRTVCGLQLGSAVESNVRNVVRHCASARSTKARDGQARAQQSALRGCFGGECAIPAAATRADRRDRRRHCAARTSRRASASPVCCCWDGAATSGPSWLSIRLGPVPRFAHASSASSRSASAPSVRGWQGIPGCQPRRRRRASTAKNRGRRRRQGAEARARGRENHGDGRASSSRIRTRSSASAIPRRCLPLSLSLRVAPPPVRPPSPDRAQRPAGSRPHRLARAARRRFARGGLSDAERGH